LILKFLKKRFMLFSLPTKWIQRAAALLLAVFSFSQATAQCPNCTIAVPAGIPSDTVYLDSFPHAQRNQYYEQQASFRFPYTTTPLAALRPGTLSGVALQSFTIVGISGLPLGLSWKLDQPTPAVYNQSSPATRDGCVTVCGTPLQAGTFTVNISILVATGITAPQAAVIPITFVVLPDSAGAGFTLAPGLGCQPLTVNFTNLVSPLPGQTATYSWDFGNGQSSTLANPDSVTYADTGVFTVTYRAIVSTRIPTTYLSGVTVTAAGCRDLLGIGSAVRPDIGIIVSSNASGIDTTTPYASNVQLPFPYNFGQDIVLVGNTLYQVNVKDDDTVLAQLPSVEDCGSVYFNSDTLPTERSPVFSLSSGPLTVQIALNRDTLDLRDTTNSTEIVVVQYCPAASIDLANLQVQNLRAFPNPSAGLVNLQFEVNQAAETQIRIQDMLGRVVLQEQLGLFQGNFQAAYDLKGFGPGVYILEVHSGIERQFQKVIIRE
jgi:PKD repeat protein